MLNKKGFILTPYIFIILIVSITIITAFYVPIFNASAAVNQSRRAVYVSMKERAGLERLYSIIRDDLTFVGIVEYTDLEKTFTVTDVIPATFKDNSITGIAPSNEETRYPFTITNATALNIQLTPQGSGAYDYDLLGENGNSILGSFATTNVYISVNIDIPKTTMVPGLYTLVVYPRSNALLVNYNYEEVATRTAKVINQDGKERILTITNQTELNISLVGE